jgi:hypothetical protein
VRGCASALRELDMAPKGELVVEHNPEKFRSRLRLYDNIANLERNWVIVGGVCHNK